MTSSQESCEGEGKMPSQPENGDGPPSNLLCPECQGLLKSAVLLPCCLTCLCRPCAFKRLAMNKKKCWLNKTEACAYVVPFNKIEPALEFRELVQDYQNGGEKYKLHKQDPISSDPPKDVEYMDTTPSLANHKPIVPIKTEQIPQEEEEYDECIGATRLTGIKSEAGASLSESDLQNLPSYSDDFVRLGTHFLKSTDAVTKIDQGLDLNGLKKETVYVEDYGQLQHLGVEEPFPHPTTLPNTPSSARTEHQSSGYWSDDSYEGTFFGKLAWDPKDPTWGQIECWEGGDMRIAYVKRLEVKCGAETGDLVEFTLSTDSEQRKVAKRVKLVEKALPMSEEDQIRSQASLKRSVEMSSGILGGLKRSAAMTSEVLVPDFNKKMKTEEDIVYPMQDIGPDMEYNDIAAADDLLDEQELSYHHHNQADDSFIQPQVKTEFANLLAVQDEPSQTCICNTTQLRRCGVCPMWFLRSESQNTILEGESITFIARIDGLEQGEEVKFVRHLPFPFLVNPGTPDFKFLTFLGPNSLVKKISPVFSGCYVFVSLMNETDYQVSVSPDSVLGICQTCNVQACEVSPNYILETPDHQAPDPLPVSVHRKDFSKYEQVNHVCGFAEIGGEDNLNYNYALVKITLNPEYRRKFSLHNDEMTVQVKRNIWLELVPMLSGGYVNLLPTSGVIGYARPVMDQNYIDQFLNPEALSDGSALKGVTTKEEDDHYETMMNKLNSLTAPVSDHRTSQSGSAGSQLSLLDQTFRGVTSESVFILPNSERSVVLFLLGDDEEGTDAKSMLKLNVQVTANDEFQYYNNCYSIETQVTTVVNSRDTTTNTFKPAVKVIVRNVRSDVAQLAPNSAIALVKINKSTKSAAKPKVTTESKPVYLRNSNKDFNATKVLDRIAKRLVKQWDQLLAENTFEKSLTVEDKYPYFTLPTRPKIPFGLTKMTDLLMRVGISQDARPMRIVDKHDGIFSCSICDTIILDRYVLQDHMYSEKHKNNMKSMQVIAGLQERLHLGRAVLQEVVDHIDPDQAHLLVGLDLVVEVLDNNISPLYHCSACRENHTATGLSSHLVSTSHVLTFLKECFPSAWNRFSTIDNTRHWTEDDFEAYTSILHKIHSICGLKKLKIVRSMDRLEDALEDNPVAAYSNHWEEIENFVSTLPAPSKQAPATVRSSKGRTIARIAVTCQDYVLSPGAEERLQCKIVNIPQPRVIQDKLLLVTKNPSLNICTVHQGFSKVYLVGPLPYVMVTVSNSSQDSSDLTIPGGTELALVKWKK